jgi:hypothetical protein
MVLIAMVGCRRCGWLGWCVVASGKVVGDPGVLDAYALSLVDSAEQIRWGASRLTVALDVLAGSGSEFLGPLGDRGGAVGQVGSGLLLLAERVRSIAKAFRAADSGKLGAAKAAVGPVVVPNLLAFKPGGSSYSGGGKPNDVASFVSVPTVVPGPGNWAGLPAALIARGKSIGERILKEGESNVKLSVADEVALGAFWWDCQSKGVADRRATEPLYWIGQLLHAPTLGRVVGQAQVNAIAAFGNAELLLPRGVDAALEFLDSDAARALSNVELQAELLKRCRVGNPVEASALETWLTFQVGTAAQAMMRGGAAFPSSDVMTAERWWGWTVPFPVKPWVARLGGLVTGNFSSPQPLVSYLKPVGVLSSWFGGQPITSVDRGVGGVVGFEKLSGVQKFFVGLVVVGVVSAAVYSGAAEVGGLVFAGSVAAGTLTALEASVLTMIVAGATAGVAGGVASRVLAVVEGDLDPKEIWTLRGVITDAAIGAVFTIASHAIAAKIAKLVALHREGGLPALRARLAELIAERKAFARQERGSVGLPGSVPVSPAGNPGPKPSNSGGPSNTVPVRPASSASTVPLLGDDLAAAQKANTLLESLTATGALPPNFVTKAQAKALGWVEGKAIGNYLPDGQIGGDIFKFPQSIGLPAAPGRIWFEADVDLISTITRKKQPGIRLLFSSDGLAFVSPDHYRRIYRLTDWK